MKSWHVDWSEDAIQQLGNLYLASSDPNRIARAQHQIDEALAQRPDQCGNEISEGLHGWQLGPLRILFEIDADKKTVLITKAKAPLLD